MYFTLWDVLKIVFENHYLVCDLEGNDMSHIPVYLLTTQCMLVALQWGEAGQQGGAEREAMNILSILLHARLLHSSTPLILIAVLQSRHYSPCLADRKQTQRDY